MKRTGWKVIGSGADTRVAEFKGDNSQDTRLSYEEAKASALQRLKDYVAPYLARIEELEQDRFLDSGTLPLLKAWSYEYANAVVTAKTKKRAMELTEETRYGFDCSWRECGGEWWYRLAREEAVWIEERNDRKQGTGVFFKPVKREEAEQIVDSYISPYRTIGIVELIGQVGRTSTATGVSSQGTPYKVTTEVRHWDWDEEHIYVNVEIDDCLGWGWRPSKSVKRDLAELAVIGANDWIKEGF
jgi:hypothetical protein